MHYKSFKEKAFRILREDIITNRLRPGQPLNERELSERLKISKTPIREAIQLLHKEGFVHFVPQKGGFVAPISLNDVREIMQIRQGLESIAAGIAAVNNDAKKLLDFEKEFQSLSKKCPRDEEGMREAGKRFHRFLIESTRNQRLIDLLDNLNGQMDRIRSLFYINLSPNYLDQALAEHMGILNAVKEGNNEDAEKMMRLHIRSYWEVLKELA